VLISSAFWLSNSRDLLLMAVLFTLLLAPVERRIGAWRTGSVFALGHIGATLLTAAGLWAALRFDAVERSVVNARDVGTSYGLLATAAALTYLLTPRLRWPYALALLGSLSLTSSFSSPDRVEPTTSRRH
jgi:Rhomboid-like protein